MSLIAKAAEYEKRLSRIRQFLAISSLYFVCAIVSHIMSIQPGSVVAFWSPAGISLWAILRFGPQVWPAIFAADLAKNVFYFSGAFSEYGSFSQLFVFAVMAFGATLQPLVGWALIETYIHNSRIFASPKHTTRFLSMTLGFGIVGATVAIATLLFSGSLPVSEAFRTWCVWWLGDCLGMALIVPISFTTWREFVSMFSRRRGLGTIGWLAVVVVLTLLTFDEPAFPVVTDYFQPFMLVPVLLWISFRHGKLGVSLACVIIISGNFLFSDRSLTYMVGSTRIPRIFFDQALSYSVVSTLLIMTSALDTNRTAVRSLEKRSRELTLKTAELKAIIAAQPDVYLWLDDRGNIVRYEAGEDSIYFSASATAQPMPDIIPMPLQDQFQEIVREVSQQREPRSIDYSIAWKSHTRYSEARFLPLLENNVLVIIRDVTHRKQAERTLRENVRKARFAAEIGAVLTSGTRLTETLSDCARLMVDHLGVKTARIWTLRFPSCDLELAASWGAQPGTDETLAIVPVGSNYAGKIAQTRKPLFTNRPYLSDEMSLAQQAAARETPAFAGYPMQFEGRLMGVIGLFSSTEIPPDIMESLASVSNTIAIGIEQQWHREEIVQAKELAERANRSKNESLAAISHEIRTPASGILEMTDRLLEADLTERQRACVESIRQDGECLLAVIDKEIQEARANEADNPPAANEKTSQADHVDHLPDIQPRAL